MFLLVSYSVCNSHWSIFFQVNQHWETFVVKVGCMGSLSLEEQRFRFRICSFNIQHQTNGFQQLIMCATMWKCVSYVCSVGDFVLGRERERERERESKRERVRERGWKCLNLCWGVPPGVGRGVIQVRLKVDTFQLELEWRKSIKRFWFESHSWVQVLFMVYRLWQMFQSLNKKNKSSLKGIFAFWIFGFGFEMFEKMSLNNHLPNTIFKAGGWKLSSDFNFKILFAFLFLFFLSLLFDFCFSSVSLKGFCI